MHAQLLLFSSVLLEKLREKNCRAINNNEVHALRLFHLVVLHLASNRLEIVCFLSSLSFIYCVHSSELGGDLFSV